MAARLRLNHVSLMVRNLDDSARYYRDVLQLPEIPSGAGRPNIRWFGIGDAQAVHLIEGDAVSVFDGGVDASAHFCITSADFDGTVRRLCDLGTPFCNVAAEQGREQTRADGVRSIYLQDPDGYWVEISEEF